MQLVEFLAKFDAFVEECLIRFKRNRACKRAAWVFVVAMIVIWFGLDDVVRGIYIPGSPLAIAIGKLLLVVASIYLTLGVGREIRRAR